MIDNALPQDLAQGILAFALANEASFLPTALVGHSAGTYATQKTRQSLRCKDGLGEYEDAFLAAMAERFAMLVERTGIKRFQAGEPEFELVAHMDGHFFARHVDTVTGRQAASRTGAGRGPVRMLSTVTYLHGQPKRFSGGNIRFTSLGADQNWEIEPQHNRLVAFPAFDPHEVLPVCLPSNRFADARFSINCWLNR